MATCTFNKTVGEIILIGQTLSNLAASAAGGIGGPESRTVTITVTDASPSVITCGTEVRKV